MSDLHITSQVRERLNDEDGLVEMNTRKKTLSLSLESALLHLQPIRDLAQNWDVDIASCLEDVLRDLTSGSDPMVAELNNESTIMASGNFSQAAILLQNAGFVYSRKVEYLYNLVLSTVRDLNNNNDKADRKKSSDASMEEFDSFDPDMQFLLLDDVLPTVNKSSSNHNSINLKEDDSDDDDQNKIKGQPTPSHANNTTYLSLGMSGSRLAEQFSRSHSPLLAPSSSQANDKIHIANIVRDTITQSNGGSYVLRLVSNLCNVDPKSGALLIPGSNIFPSATTTATAAHQKNLNNQNVTYDDDHDNDYDLPLHDDSHSVASNSFAHEINNSQQQPNVSDIMSSNHQKANTVYGNNENNGQPPMPETIREEQTHTTAIREDPYTALLNPQDPGPIKPRPLKIGITYKLPNTAVLEEQDDHHFVSYIPEQIQLCKITGKVLFMRQKSHVDPPLLGLAFGDEFAYIAKNIKRNERLLVRKNNVQSRKTSRENVVNYDVFDADNEEHGGFHDDGDEDYDSIHNDEGCNIQADIFEKCDIESNHGDVLLSELRQHKTFEDLCREHVKELAKKAEKYAVETQLSKRVNQWQSQIIPFLALEEKRPDFEIHNHGRSIMKQLVQEQKTTKHKEMDFQLLVKDCETYGVCRSFISALMLCNTENILLKNSSGGGLLVELLNPEFTVAMDTYEAPGVEANRCI